ncbi:MAG: DUF58 domain-containing protein [Spirochaetes bacterium]|nr:DUF58 domain-containing protein [Spirochaetota bacterium]
MKDSKTVRVFRAKLNKLYLVSRRLVEELLSGSYRSVFRGPGLEFADVREYTVQDDARLIDWNVTARTGTPYARIYREERELVLFFVVDVSASLSYIPTIHRRWELQQMVLALLSFCAIQNNDKVGAVFFSHRIEKWIPPRKGKHHVLRLMNDLLGYQPQGKGSDLGRALKTVGGQLKKRAILFILSDFKTGGYARELALVSRKHDVIAVRLYEDLDEDFPIQGYVRLQDPETESHIPAVGFSRSFRESYSEYRTFWRRIWFRECIRRGVDTLEIAGHEDPGQRLIQFFQKRRKYR